MKHNSVIILLILLFSSLLLFSAYTLKKEAVSETIPSKEVVEEIQLECSRETPDYCQTESECINIGANWCEEKERDKEGNLITLNFCNVECPSCSKESPWLCRSKEECTNAGAKWCVTTEIIEGIEVIVDSVCSEECEEDIE